MLLCNLAFSPTMVPSDQEEGQCVWCLTEFLTQVRTTTQHNWPIVASVLPLTPSLLLKSHPMVMLKPVPASQKGERRIVRLLWFQRCSRTHCPWRIWSWRTWKGYMNFGQRRKPNTKPDMTDALGTPNYLSSFSYNFPRSTQPHLCEGDISAFELFTNKNLKFSILKAVWAMKHRYLFV